MYKSEFEKAVERTREFNLSCPEVVFGSGTLLTQEKMEKFPYIFRETVGEISLNEIVAECLSIHHRLSDVIEKLFRVPCYFTIGHVETKEQVMFHQSEDDLKYIIKNGINGSDVNVHAWLTLPTMEILDFSLPSSYAICNGLKEGIGGLIADHPDNLVGGVKYHPMLVGDDFLRKSGGLVDL